MAKTKDHSWRSPIEEHHHHHPQNPRYKKFRATCDFCAISKVKCDRGQPQCIRCIRSGIECQYSESRRAGRARRLLTASQHTRSDSSARATQGHTPLSEGFTAAGRQINTSPLGALYDASTLSAYSLDVDMFQHDIVGPDTSPSQQDSLPSVSSQNMTSHDQQLTSESMADFHPQFDLGTLEHVPTLMPNSSSSDFNDNNSLSRSPASHENGCMRQACAAFNNLHVPVPCRSSTSEQKFAIRGMDDSLKANRGAQETVLQILACPCSDSWYLSFLLVLIAHRIMESYLNLLSRQLSATPLPPVDSTASHGELCHCQGEEPCAQCDVTMNLGGYILRGKAKDKVIAYVLRSQIEDMDSLIDTLSTRYVKSASDEAGAPSHQELVDSLKLLQKKALQLNM